MPTFERDLNKTGKMGSWIWWEIGGSRMTPSFWFAKLSRKWCIHWVGLCWNWTKFETSLGYAEFEVQNVQRGLELGGDIWAKVQHLNTIILTNTLMSWQLSISDKCALIKISLAAVLPQHKNCQGNFALHLYIMKLCIASIYQPRWKKEKKTTHTIP